MSDTHLLVEPEGTVSFRGNTGFSSGANLGRSMMPPWPSTLAGALRSRMLVEQNLLETLRRDGRLPTDEKLTEVLGEEPAKGEGTFRIVEVAVVHQGRTYHPLPADLVAFEREEGGGIEAVPLRPVALADLAARCSAPLERVPVLVGTKRRKPVGDVWIRGDGLAAHLRGERVGADRLVRSSALWGREVRVGVALNPGRRSAEEGQLFTTERIRMKEAPDTGLYVRVAGAGGLLDGGGWVRLGGDGAIGRVRTWEVAPEDRPPEAASLGQGARRFRLVLATPGLFAGGWLPGRGAPPEFELNGVRARVVAAAVPRYEPLSGWDVRHRRPKPLVRAVPAGAVYWCEIVEGTVGGLAAVQGEGLWTAAEREAFGDWRSRWAEGFNGFRIGAWPDDP